MSFVRIGVFDSGLGGLSVVRSIFRRQPRASIIYFADVKHVPYGGRPLDEVHGFAMSISDFLLSEGASAVLMACNISSAVALDDAKIRHSDVPIVGVVSAGARAAARVADGPITVLATAGTVASGSYPKQIAELTDFPVIQTPCPRFVPLVESGELSGPDALDAAKEYVAPGLEQGSNTFILGCTHYPFLIDVLRMAAPDARFVDPAEEAAKQILETIGDSLDTVTPSRYILSAPSPTFRPVGSKFLGEILPELEIVNWTGNRLILEAPTVCEG